MGSGVLTVPLELLPLVDALQQDAEGLQLQAHARHHPPLLYARLVPLHRGRRLPVQAVPLLGSLVFGPRTVGPLHAADITG